MKKVDSEVRLIAKEELVDDFKQLGINNGTNLMVHSSLSKIGWVIGGAPVVVSALIDVIGKDGTLVMPAATPNCLHPSLWDKPISKNWFSKFEKHLPVFDPETTPSTMGIIPETFRNWPGSLRSNHPISSVCARGKLANEVIHHHQLELSEGINTPYEKVYQFNFEILLLGVGFNRCTMLHFAESRSHKRRLTISKYPIIRNNKRMWLEVQDMGNDNSTHFPTVGEMYLKEGKAVRGKIGQADAILLPTRSLVDFGTEYFDNL